MDKKTEELRDIFMDVADAETVTESQEEQRGSLIDEPETEHRIEELIDEMQDRYEFATALDTQQLCWVVEAVFNGYSDTQIADELDADPAEILEARLDLHLFTDDDLNVSIDLEAFRQRVTVDEVTAPEALALEFDLDPETATTYRQIVRAQDESRRANDRYRDEFASLLGDADLSGSLTSGATEDGLDDATEGMETDVSF